MSTAHRTLALTSVPLAAIMLFAAATGPATATADQLAQQHITTQAAHLKRTQAAETARLQGQAARSAATERHKALDQAKTTGETAAAVAETAAAHLPETSLADLRQANDELTTLVQATPPVVVVTTKDTPLPALTDPRPVDIPAVVAEATANPGATTQPPPPPAGTLTPAVEVTIEPASTSTPANTPPKTELIAVVNVTVAPGAVTTTTEPLKDLTSAAVDASQSISAAAQKVATLTEQVNNATEQAIAAEQERVAAEQERIAAEEAAAAAAAERARQIEAVASFPNGEIPRDLLCEVPFSPGQYIRCDAVDALVALNQKFTADHGYPLTVISSYRSYADQVDVKRTRGRLAATPGTSNHGLALAVDLRDFGGEANFSHPHYLWMQANAAEFGWKHPAALGPGGSGPQEPWHWEFGL